MAESYVPFRSSSMDQAEVKKISIRALDQSPNLSE